MIIKLDQINEHNQKLVGGMAYLNDKYELDGGDPNSYTGVAWYFGKHDRSWSKRPVLDKIRYMNANGLKRKFDTDAYVAKMEKMANH